MGHYRRVRGNLEYSKSSFKEAGYDTEVTAADLKKGQTVKMNGKPHQYLGSTKGPDGEVHHFQNHNNGKYASFHTNEVPPMQSRDQMETGDNSGDCSQ